MRITSKMKFLPGLIGERGDDGISTELQIGSVSTLSYGSSATALITGSAPLQTMSLGLPSGATGPVGEGEGGLFFETRAAAASATIAVDINAIRTAGFSSVGDGGHGLYKRRSGAP